MLLGFEGRHAAVETRKGMVELAIAELEALQNRGANNCGVQRKAERRQVSLRMKKKFWADRRQRLAVMA